MFNKIKIILMIFVAALTVQGAAVLAHGSGFFEFAPYTSNSGLNFTSGTALYHEFKPRNDFIGGFDVWLENSGSAGSASFGLRDGGNNLLASKTVSIPNIPKQWGGAKFHVDFDEPAGVAGGEIYKIKMLSSMPNLKIYYANPVEILEHNSSLLTNDILRQSVVGSDTQEFSFKIALYENSDNLPPLVSNIVFSSVFLSETKAEFNANEPVDWRIEFWPEGGAAQSSSFGGAYRLCPEGIFNCGLTVKTSPNTVYNFKLFVKDEWGNESQASGFFRGSESQIQASVPTSTTPTSTPPEVPQDSAGPPVISNAGIISVSTSSVKAYWRTDKAANSKLFVSLDSAGERIASQTIDSTYELEHALETKNVLVPSTHYFAKIVSSAPSGDSASQIFEFDTQGEVSAPKSNQKQAGNPETPQPQNEPPLVQNEGETISQPLLTVNLPSVGDGVSASSIIIEWQALVGGEPSDGYRVDIFNSDYDLERQISAPAGTHRLIVENLSEGEHHIIVYANNGGVLEKVAKEAIVVIPKQPGFFSGYFSGGYRLIFAVFGLLAVIAAAVFAARKLAKSKAAGAAGFTLLEFMVSVAVLVSILTAVGFFVFKVSDFRVLFAQKFEVESEIQYTLQPLIIEIRSVAVSNVGSYPIASAASTSLVFFSDIDEDGLVEQVRYFLEGDILKKGVIKPTGNPLQYLSSNEIIVEKVHNMAVGTSTIFSYYDENYSGSEAPMSEPVNIVDIRMIEARISAYESGNTRAAPLEYKIRTAPRNLRSN